MSKDNKHSTPVNSDEQEHLMDLEIDRLSDPFNAKRLPICPVCEGVIFPSDEVEVIKGIKQHKRY